MGREGGSVGLELLPHGPGFRFLTRIESLRPGRHGVGIWDVTGAEWFFLDHFPGDAVVPGVLLAEAAAQLSGIVWNRSSALVRLARVDIKVLQAARPPLVIRVESELERAAGTLGMFAVSASGPSGVLASGRLTLAEGTT